MTRYLDDRTARAIAKGWSAEEGTPLHELAKHGEVRSMPELLNEIDYCMALDGADDKDRLKLSRLRRYVLRCLERVGEGSYRANWVEGENNSKSY